MGQINQDIAFNAREIRQRAIRKELSVSEIVVGQVRPINPCLRLQLFEFYSLKYATPIYPYEIELQATKLETHLQGYFFNNVIFN